MRGAAAPLFVFVCALAACADENPTFTDAAVDGPANVDAATDAPAPDRDSDGVPDADDNCPDDPNPGQENDDNDPQGNACDTDDDNDTVGDADDNCPTEANVGQEDTDNDPNPTITAGTFALRPTPANAVPVSGDDAVSGPLDIGFSFTFFDQPFTTFNVSTNGFITFGDTNNGCCSGSPMPDAGGPQGIIALYWEDLIVNPGQITYETQGTAPNRELVVSYNNVPHLSSSNLVNGQIVLHEGSNLIELLCATCMTDGGIHSQGVEDVTGMFGGTMPGRSAISFSLTNDAVLIDTSPGADGTGDACDVCPTVFDPAQLDGDSDEIGDLCDICPAAPDPQQLDNDEDGHGDACENCPGTSNPTQSDLDEDGVGDACDDSDKDLVFDDLDNCRTTTNPGQENDDGDSFGNACDNCPTVFNEDQADFDGDMLGDACEDSDADGIFDLDDNCVSMANPLQENQDNDARGNICDNCPTVPNDAQTDSDLDGIGDFCEALDPTFDSVIVGGNLFATGVGLAARNSVATSSANLVVSGIPAGSTIVTARLYWMMIGGTDDSVALNGTPFTGMQIATAPDTCWSRPAGNFAYRADVGSVVTGNGTYVITGYTTDNGVTDSQGASLVIVYDDPADTRNNLVKIAEGAVGYVGDGGVAASNLSGFTIAAGFDRAREMNIIADGQPFPEEFFLGGVQVGGGDPFHGADGTYWDTRWDDIGAMITPPQTSFEARLTSSNDCLAWTVNALVVEDVTGTFTPP